MLRRTTSMHNSCAESGFTLIEILVVVAISGMLLLSLGNVVGNVSGTHQDLQKKIELEREAAFVMRRIVQVISRASWVEMKKDDANEWHYHFAADPERDIDKDGYAEADDDRDGRSDEDDVGDMNGDGASGILGVDDDGDGDVDEEPKDDDDEDGKTNEDIPTHVHLKWKDDIFEQEDRLGFLIVGKDKPNKLITIISERVTSFTATTPAQTGRYAIVQVSIVLTADDGVTTSSLSTSVRLGGRL